MKRLDINQESFVPKRVYNPEEIKGLDPSWSLQKTGELKGKTYEVYTKSITHKTGWKCIEGLKAFAATFFSLGIALFFSKVVSMWRAAVTGKELREVKVLKVLNGTEEKTDLVGKKRSSSFNFPNSSQVETIHNPPPKASKKGENIPSSLYSVKPPVSSLPSQVATIHNPSPSIGKKSENIARPPSLLKEIDPAQKLPELPSILSLVITKEAHPKLFEAGRIYTKEHDEQKPGYEPCLRYVMEKRLLKWTETAIGAMRNLVGSSSDDEVTAIDERFMARFNAYDEALHLRDRLSLSKDLPHIKELQVQDIEAPWSESGLQIALLSDNELAEMAVERFNELTSRQKELVNLRMAQITPSANIPKAVGTISELKLNQLRAVPVSLIEDHIAEMSIPLLNLLTETQQDQIDPEILNDDQFKHLYRKESRIRKLRNPKLEICVSRLVEVEYAHFLADLTEEQIQSLDFTKPNMGTKAIVDGLSNKGAYREDVRGRGIKALTASQLIDCLNGGLLDEHTAYCITPEQAASADFTKVDVAKATPKAITAMFRNTNACRAFKAAALNHLIGSVEHAHYLAELTEAQIQSLDFTKSKVGTKAVLDGLSNKGAYREDVRGRGIKALTASQLIDCLNGGLLDEHTAYCITPEQAASADFTKVDVAKATPKAITAMFRNAGTCRSFKAGALNHLMGLVERADYLANLTDEQIQSLDFTKPGVGTKAILDGLSNKGAYREDVRGKGIKALTANQVIDCLNGGLLDEHTAYFITPEQAASADFTKVDVVKATRQAITAMFRNAGTCQAFKSAALNHLMGLVERADYLEALTDAQIQSLDFTKPGVGTKAILDGLSNKGAYREDVRGKGIKALTANQVIECFNRGLFDKDTARFITNAQLQQINLDLLANQDSEVVKQLKKRKSEIR